MAVFETLTIVSLGRDSAKCTSRMALAAHWVREQARKVEGMIKENISLFVRGGWTILGSHIKRKKNRHIKRSLFWQRTKEMVEKK